MFSRGQGNGHDDTDATGVPPNKWAKRRDLAKKKTQSPKMGPGFRKKIQKFLQGPEEQPIHNSQYTPMELEEELEEEEEDMVLCKPRRRPTSYHSGMRSVSNGHSRPCASSKSFIGEVELNREGNIRIPCTIHHNGPTSDQAVSGEESSSDYVDEGKTVEEATSPRRKSTRREEEIEERLRAKREGSSTIVEHILKELQGINKIQEEISDLRHYLSSVKGSVDEVSCCVDAVLTEIEELYTGNAYGPHLSPKTMGRHASPRRPVATLPRRHSSPPVHQYTFPKDKERVMERALKQRREVTASYLGVDVSAGQRPQRALSPRSSGSPVLGGHKSRLPYLDRRYGADFQSTSSLSSCPSCRAARREDRYRSRSAGLPASASEDGAWSGEAAWSEEDACSCHFSLEEGETCRGSDTGDGYTGADTSSTPGHSSRSSSEHLSLLFGRYYDSASSSSSVVDWKAPRAQSLVGVECDCTPNCPYSRSSGYHTIDAYADDLGSGPSRSLSHSTVALTDYDAHSTCERCLSAERLDIDSAESTEREWPEQGPCQDASEEDWGNTPEQLETESPEMEYDVKQLGHAMSTFRSALRGAMKELDAPGSRGYPDDEYLSDSASVDGYPQREPVEGKRIVQREGRRHLRNGFDVSPSLPQLDQISEASLRLDDHHSEGASEDQAYNHQTLSAPESPLSPAYPRSTHKGSLSFEESPRRRDRYGDPHIPECPSEFRSERVGLDSEGVEPNLEVTEGSPNKADFAQSKWRTSFKDVLKEKKETRRRLSVMGQGSIFSDDESHLGRDVICAVSPLNTFSSVKPWATLPLYIKIKNACINVVVLLLQNEMKMNTFV